MPNLLNSYGRTKAFVDITGLTVVNLSGSQSFVEDVVFPKGVYSIDVVAGSTFCGVATDVTSTTVGFNGVGGKVVTEVTIYEPFIIRAYCGSKGNYGVGGTNPYSGAFKVNAAFNASTPILVTHIFGNVGGSAAINNQSVYFPGSGNCLGNGIGVNTNSNLKMGIGAGSCLHFLPVNGIFGTNYLFAAHCGPAATGWRGSPKCAAGNGSVYGGAAGGVSATTPNYSVSSYNGGSTLFGIGGTGVVGSLTDVPVAAEGTGIGAGKTNATSISSIKNPRTGSAAFFKDGVWQNSDLYGNKEEDGHIIVKCIGYL